MRFFIFARISQDKFGSGGKYEALEFPYLDWNTIFDDMRADESVSPFWNGDPLELHGNAG